MLSNVVDNVEDYFKSTTEAESRNYYTYPTLTDGEKAKVQSVNNFIGVFCPRGYYYQDSDGMIEIISDATPVVSSTQQMANNLSNFISNNPSGSSDSIESFSNHEMITHANHKMIDINRGSCVWNDLVWVVVILFLIFFLRFYN